MKFKDDKLIILTEEGLKHYWMRSDEIGDIYRVSLFDEELSAYAQSLNNKNKDKFYFSREHYRFATESEVKKYKIKNLF
jgi:hypothetical protein